MSRLSTVLCAGLLLLGATVARAQTTREISYTSHSVAEIHTRLRFTTLIILPETEQILDFVCGDKEFWVVSGAQNLAYVKPAKAGASTNLNLVTASGNIYSFLLSEGAADADLKVYVVGDDSMNAAKKESKRFYTETDVDGLREAAAAAKKDAETARKEATTAGAEASRRADDQVKAFKASYPTRLTFPYVYKAHQKPFDVSAIYTDGTFTYIHANAAELPALYELKDAAPSLVNFQVEHGVFIVPKVLDRGYLAIGKQKLTFSRLESGR